MSLSMPHGLTIPRKFVVLVGLGLFLFSQNCQSGEHSVFENTNETVLERTFVSGLPNSFDEIAFALSRAIGPDHNPSHILIPLGRSLQRDKASCETPRILVAMDGDKTHDMPVKVFLGYVDKTGQSEAIVWNDVKGRYDFLLVEGIGSGRPQIVRPPRGVCITCHQNEGPIFARAPWSETNIPGFGGPTMITAITECLKKEYHRKTGLPDDGDPFHFDRTVRVANNALENREICERLCLPTDFACKASLFAAALREEENREIRPKNGWKRTTEEKNFWKQYAPLILKDGFARVSSVIPDRRPLDKPWQGGTTVIGRKKNPKADSRNPIYDNSLAGTDPFLVGPKDKKVVLESEFRHSPDFDVQEIPGNSGLADPKTPRPRVLSGIADAIKTSPDTYFDLNLAKICFNLDPIDIASLPLPKENLADYIFSRPESKDLLASWPPPKEKTINFFGGETEEADCPKAEIAPILPQDFPIKELFAVTQAEAKTPTFLFKKYCSECHDEIGAMVSGYKLPLDNFEAMQKYGTSSNRPNLVKQLLKDKIMPGKGATIPLSDEDRKVLLDFLK